MWTHLFSWYPRQNSGTVPVPEYKVSTLYSGTKLGTESLCEHIFRWCPGTLPTNHLFSYPQFLVPLEISIVSVCSVYWMWTYLQTGYCVSEHSTILCRCPGTSAWAPSVNTALLTDWLIDSLTNSLTDSLTDSLTNWLNNRPIDWLTASLTHWLTDSLTHWLTHSLIHWLTH